MSNNDKTGPVDAIEMAVITSRLQGIAHDMANTVLRTGRSGVINNAHDFSCCILSKDSEMLVMAESLPIHVMQGPDIMARSMKEFHPDLRRGDAFLHNSPYHGNTHPADFSILVPIIDDDGNHQFTAFAKGHLADCGNSLPTTYMAAARDVYEEGALIFPAVKIQDNYKDIDDIIRICKMRIRAPEIWWGDYLALLGAARIGERRLLEVGREVGWDRLNDYKRQYLDYSEQMMINAIKKLPDGRATATGMHDPFPGVPDGIPVTATVEVRTDDAMIDIDLTDNPDCQPCGLNQSEATARVHSLIAVFRSIDSAVPPNSGSFRRVNIKLRENSVAGIPRHPASCSVATTNYGNRLGGAVQRALAELGKDVGMAEDGAIMAPGYAVISGKDPRRKNEAFVNQLLLGDAGGAASPIADGWVTIGDQGASGMVFADSVESDELQYPILVTARHIIPDSEGAGRFRGAPGTYVEFAPLDCSIEAMYASDGGVYPAPGAQGGLAGAPARQYKSDASGSLIELDPMGPISLGSDESIQSYGAGGGGYGFPHERDPLLVQKDVEEGWVSRKRAEEVYGVVLDEHGSVNMKSTLARRNQMAQSN